jgi:hypothetical protein
MARRVFFSFDYLDVADFRANVVRQHGMTKLDRDTAGFFDASLWEVAKRQGDLAVKRLINSAMNGTSVTCVLIGSETYQRRWVRYEIVRSLKKGSRIIGIHINSIAGKDSRTKGFGPNPLSYLGITFSDSGLTATIYELINEEWLLYTEVDGRASWRLAQPRNRYRGQGFQLTDLFPTYDWVADKGYDNFSEWVR